MPTDGGTGGRSRRDSANQIASKKMRAARAQCPKCGRKGAIRRYDEPGLTGHYCYWIEQGKCDYKDLREVKMDWEA